MTTFRILGIAFALTGIVALYPNAAQADTAQAISTAVQHAGFAASGADIATARRHLHHVLNCLVGPDGDGFDASPGNPCAAAGGAIPQTSDPALKMKLEGIASQVRSGIENESLDAAKRVATDVQTMLNQGA
jgi:hypothetical protein